MPPSLAHAALPTSIALPSRRRGANLGEAVPSPPRRKSHALATQPSAGRPRWLLPFSPENDPCPCPQRIQPKVVNHPVSPLLFYGEFSVDKTPIVRLLHNHVSAGNEAHLASQSRGRCDPCARVLPLHLLVGFNPRTIERSTNDSAVGDAVLSVHVRRFLALYPNVQSRPASPKSRWKKVILIRCARSPVASARSSIGKLRASFASPHGCAQGSPC